MLSNRPFARRSREHGQTLIMALAFVAFFGVVVVAMLRVADVSNLQHVRTESTAVTDSSAEGGAALAAADAGRTDVSLICAAGNTGTVTMQNNDKASYTVNGCNPGSSGGSGGTGGTVPGTNCILCVLNLNPSPTNPSNVVLNLSCGNGCGTDLTTSGGDIYVNGSISSGSSITANPTASTHIRFLNGATYAGRCTCSPAATSFAPAITDPLATVGSTSYFGPPSPAATGKPTINTGSGAKACGTAGTGSSWSAANGCSVSLTSGNVTVSAGLWSSLDIKTNANVTMATGVYAFTGPLTLSGQANLTGTAVTLFLTCAGYGPSGTLCAAGTSGGSINLGGQGSANITAPGSAQYTHTIGGQTESLSILADTGLVDPDLSQCPGNGNKCAFISQGQGGGISGSIDLHGAGASLGGNGTATITGRLVVNSLQMQISGHIGSGLSLSGSIPGVNTATCGVFDSAVSGTTGATSSTGRAIVQSQCGTGSLSGVVAFNYKP
ncbi:MAG TPA: hypothetical protein VFC09_03685 [Candidatus Dormibacteraeota bacterium]|nr:hypothetical protein [Candidatus Dormibacteraeota bacterium]